METKKIHENTFIHYGKKVLGVILIITGIIGLFLPFLQGVVMIMLGVALLGGKPAVRWMKHLAKQAVARARRIWS